MRVVKFIFHFFFGCVNDMTHRMAGQKYVKVNKTEDKEEEKLNLRNFNSAGL